MDRGWVACVRAGCGVAAGREVVGSPVSRYVIEFNT